MKLVVKIFILLYITSSYSQKGVVYYGFIKALEIGNLKGPDSNAYMIFNKEQSYYVTSKDSLEKIENKNIQRTFLNDNDSGGVIYNGLKVGDQGDQVVYNIKKDTIWSNLLYGKYVYIKEPNPKINWKIEKETKKIGNFTCQKASANFRGRNYIVWFTFDIPVKFGPWKLNGLPGLILEAYDKNKEVYWYLKSVDYNTNKKLKIKNMFVPDNVEVLTYQDFKSFQKNEQEKTLEKGRILKQSYPEIEVIKAPLSAFFIECN